MGHADVSCQCEEGLLCGWRCWLLLPSDRRGEDAVVMHGASCTSWVTTVVMMVVVFHHGVSKALKYSRAEKHKLGFHAVGQGLSDTDEDCKTGGIPHRRHCAFRFNPGMNWRELHGLLQLVANYYYSHLELGVLW